MWVLPVKKLLELDEIIAHEVLQAQGALVRWEPGMQTLSSSHIRGSATTTRTA